MWSSAQLKMRAKQELKISYWTSFLVCLLGGLLGAELSSGGFSTNFSNFRNSFNRGYNGNVGSYYGGSFNTWSGEEARYIATVAAIAFFIVLVVIAVAVIYATFVGGPATVGVKGFFISAPYGNREFSNMFSGFKNGRYMKNVKNMFMKNLFVFLWSLLFIIPGIIKHYEYYMVPYILNDSPDLSYKDAMEYSKRMTNGQKLDIWVLELSFLGWILLAALTCGIGMIFLMPYMEATKAQLYIELRYQMFNSQQYGGNMQQQQYGGQQYYN